MRLVIDASITIAWIATDERSAYAEAALAACGTDAAVVPLLWRWEIANALLVLERRSRLTDASAALERVLSELRVVIAENDSLAHRLREMELARRHELSIYDAAYLAAAKDEGLRLATLDDRLQSAADAEDVRFIP